ncbi:ParB N-terminal domain-containing protein [Rhodosalinus sediminis]|uniref:ParB N-terminal domain-containing protein n=1 Tax=Rhodosalinus sediminis TaxID=1940533 RepID=UPI0023564BEA|nr:ParB N-terminal domain-containing protein [Rhodosalinus sediminis]
MAPDPDKLTTDIQRLPIAALVHLEVNARYMTADQQRRLTENIKRDGGLTSLPLVWRIQRADGTPESDPPTYEIISGNHRVISAREAGLTEIDCLVITNWIPPERRVEIQLAHNAVSGQDDLAILEALYESLPLAGKEYSGLTDDAFSSLRDIALTGFNVDAPDYQEIVLSFLPEDAEQFHRLVERARKSPQAQIHAAQMGTFDAMFDAIVRVKEVQNVQNTGMALATLAELAMERLDQIEAEEPEDAETSADTTGQSDETDADAA